MHSLLTGTLLSGTLLNFSGFRIKFSLVPLFCIVMFHFKRISTSHSFHKHLLICFCESGSNSKQERLPSWSFYFIIRIFLSHAVKTLQLIVSCGKPGTGKGEVVTNLCENLLTFFFLLMFFIYFSVTWDLL